MEPIQVQVRLAQESDHTEIMRLFRSGMLEGQLRDGDTGADVDHLIDGYFSDEGASGFWIATIDADGDERIVGMIGVQRTGENSAEIRRLRVDEEFRRRGVGTSLMNEAVTFCHRRGYLKVVLDVRIERAPAIAMFEKTGFQLARTREIDERKTLEFYLDLYSDPK